MKRMKKIFAAIAALTTMATMTVPACSAESTGVTAETLRGDIDNNGIVELTDLTYLSIYLVGDRDFTEEQKKVADMTGDGKVDIADLPSLKAYLMDDVVQNEDNVVENYSLEQVVTSPKKYYYIGEEFDASRGVFSCKNESNGELVTFEASEATIDSSKFDNTKEGIYDINVSYGETTFSYQVYVLEEGMDIFEFTKLPDKNAYEYGEDADLTGGLISGRSGDKEFYDIPMTDPMFEASICYAEDGATVMVDVLEYNYYMEFEVVYKNGKPYGYDDSSDYVNLYWAESPKKVYYVGEEFDYETGSIYGSGYTNGIYWDIFSFAPHKLSQVTVDVSEFDNSKPGEYVIGVKVGGGSLYYVVTVIEAE